MYQPGYGLVFGQGFELAQRRTPVYPAFIAAVMALTGQDLSAIAFVQHLLGVATAGMVFAIGCLAAGPVVGAVAGLLFALSSPAAYLRALHHHRAGIHLLPRGFRAGDDRGSSPRPLGVVLHGGNSDRRGRADCGRLRRCFCRSFRSICGWLCKAGDGPHSARW